MVSWSAVLRGHCWREVSCVRVCGEVVLIYVKGLCILFVVDGTKEWICWKQEIWADRYRKRIWLRGCSLLYLITSDIFIRKIKFLS